MSKIKNNLKIFIYEIYEDREGNRKLRSVSQKRLQNEDYDKDNLITSSKSLQELKEFQWAYEEGIIGIGAKTGSMDYLETIEWGQMGGRPKKWDNEAQRKRFERALVKLAKNLSLTGEQLALIIQHGSLGRPMTATERKRLSRYRQGK